MPNVASVLRDEIQRLAKKQVKAALGPLKRDQIRLKKTVADLRRQVAALETANRDLLKKVTTVVAVNETEKVAEKAVKLRPTSKSLEGLRNRLALTQVQFGKLLGVTGPAVTQWASRNGRVRMRQTTLDALAGIQHIGKREARRRLEGMGVPITGRTAPRRRRRGV